jgi:hypothetical protein
MRLAEHRDARMHARHQLHHHGAHALEKTGAEFAFEDVAQIVRRMHAILLWLRIQIVLGRREQHVDAFLLELVDVGSERARIFVEILIWTELQPVNEDTRHDRIAVLAREPHQRQMALVQIAHGRNEGGAILAAQLVAQFVDRTDDIHFL